MHTILLTRRDRERLERNGQRQKEAQERGEELDLEPVVKLRTADGRCTWLLTEIYPDDRNLAFGLCDLGLGITELGDVDLAELARLRSPDGYPVMREPEFMASKTLSAYAEHAYRESRVIA
jgi:hypothetical protein